MRKTVLSLGLATLCVSGYLAVGQASLTIISNRAERPVTGLPFSADMTVRTEQQLANGVNITHEVKGRVYRSSQGVERWEGTAVATDTAMPQPATLVWVVDPVQHTAVNWNTNFKTAFTNHLPPNGTAVVKFLPEPRVEGSPSVAQAMGSTDVTTTELGRQTQDKLLLIGKRVTGTIAVGKIGNEKPIVVMHDSWVSPDLKLVVKELYQDPRTGNRTMEMTHIRREEPDTALFVAPAEYMVKERPDVLSHPPTGVSLGTHVGDAGVPDVEAGRIAEARNDADPEMKSEVAYKLAMDKTDLLDAQSLAEEAVKLEEERTVGLDVKNMDVNAFAQMTALSRYWNTLGWVYYRQGKLPLAESYTKAAWDLDPRGYFGSHLGKIYEEQGRREDAIEIYRMALSARKSAKEEEQIRGRLADLGVGSAEALPISIPMSLPSLSSSMRRPEMGDAVFDVLLTHGAAAAVAFVSGSAVLKESEAMLVQGVVHVNLPDSGPEKVVQRVRVRCSADGRGGCTAQLLTAQEAKFTGSALEKR